METAESKVDSGQVDDESLGKIPLPKRDPILRTETGTRFWRLVRCVTLTGMFRGLRGTGLVSSRNLAVNTEDE